MVKNIIQSIKSVLFKDPLFLFEEEKAFVNQPFYFKGTNGKGVILVHGWSSTAYEVRRLGEFLNEKGYTVCGPMLRGHGTKPEDLENVKWEEWLADLEKAYEEMEKEVDRIYVGGTSVGSCLALLLAQKKKNISGLILMATPFKIRLEKLMIFFAKMTVKIKPFNQKVYPPTFGASTTITRLISYQKYSVRSALETFELIEKARKNLWQITQPCLLIQSSSDHIVAKKSLEEIYNRVGSKIKRKKYIKKAYHTFISDIKNEDVFEDILNFLNEN
jgi:carboxylesterase